MSHHMRLRAHLNIATEQLMSTITLLEQSHQPSPTKLLPTKFIKRFIDTFDSLTMKQLHDVPTGHSTNTSLDPINPLPAVNDGDNVTSMLMRRPLSFACMTDRISMMYYVWEHDCRKRRGLARKHQQLCNGTAQRLISRRIASEAMRVLPHEKNSNSNSNTDMVSDENQQHSLSLTQGLPPRAAAGLVATLVHENKQIAPKVSLVQDEQQSIPLWKQQLIDKRALHDHQVSSATKLPVDESEADVSKGSNKTASILKSESKERKTDEGREVKHNDSVVVSTNPRGSVDAIAQLVSSIIHDASDDTPENVKIIENELMTFQSVTAKPALIWKRDPIDEARIARQKAKKQAGRMKTTIKDGDDMEPFGILKQAADTFMILDNISASNTTITTKAPPPPRIATRSQTEHDHQNLMVDDRIVSSSDHQTRAIQSCIPKRSSSRTLSISCERVLTRICRTILLPWLLTDHRQHLNQNETYDWGRRQPYTSSQDNDYYPSPDSRPYQYDDEKRAVPPPWMSYPFSWFDNPLVLKEQYPLDRAVPEVLESKYNHDSANQSATRHLDTDYKERIFQQHKTSILAGMNNASLSSSIIEAKEKKSTAPVVPVTASSHHHHQQQQGKINGEEGKKRESKEADIIMNDVPHSAIPRPGVTARPWHDMYKLHGLRLPERARGWRFNWPIWRQHHIIPELSPPLPHQQISKEHSRRLGWAAQVWLEHSSLYLDVLCRVWLLLISYTLF
jgi:hypothetical protein